MPHDKSKEEKKGHLATAWQHGVIFLVSCSSNNVNNSCLPDHFMKENYWFLACQIVVRKSCAVRGPMPSLEYLDVETTKVAHPPNSKHFLSATFFCVSRRPLFRTSPGFVRPTRLFSEVESTAFICQTYKPSQRTAIWRLMEEAILSFKGEKTEPLISTATMTNTSKASEISEVNIGLDLSCFIVWPALFNMSFE